MPKLKTNKSAAKRFKKTGSGGFKYRNANRNHILTKKSTKRKRHLRAMDMVDDSSLGHVRQMMPYA
jgi:large subunit ribosomal protein L35